MPSPSNGGRLPIPSAEEVRRYTTPTTSDTSAPASMLPPPPPDAVKVYSDYDRVRKIIDRPVLDANLLGTEETTEEELDAIAKYHGVDASELKGLSTFFGARRKDEEIGKAAAGAVSRMVGFGLPQWVVKKSEGDENFRRALDDVRELADKKRSWLEFAAESVGPGGAIRLGKGIAGKLAAGAATGAIYEAAGSREGQELESAAIGAGLGAGLGAVASKLSRNGVAKETVEAVTKEAEDNSLRIQELADRRLAETRQSEDILRKQVLDLSDGGGKPVTPDEAGTILREQLRTRRTAEEAREAGMGLTEQAKEISDLRTREFAQYLSGADGTLPKSVEEAREVIRTGFTGDNASERISRAYDEFLRTRTAREVVERGEFRMKPDEMGPLARVADFLSDAKFTLRRIAQDTGIDLESTHNYLNSRYNVGTHVVAERRKELGRIYAGARKAGIDLNSEEVGTRIIDAIESGNLDNLSVPERKLADEMSAFYTKGRELVNSSDASKRWGVSPLSIPERKNYVPAQIKSPVEFIRALEQQADRALHEIGTTLGRKVTSFDQLSPAEVEIASKEKGAFTELLRGLELFDSNKGRLQSGASVSHALTEATTPGVARPKLETIASAALHREDTIPAFLREKNVFRLADRWTNNTFRHMFLREGLERMSNEAKLLRQLGADRQATYVENLIRDIAGVRGVASWTGGRANAFRLAMDRAAERAGRDTLQGKIYEVGKDIPDILSAMAHNVYANYLGASPKALIQNLTQTIFRTAPEVGGTYGYSKVGKAIIDAARNWSMLSRRLDDMGLEPASFTGEGQEYLRRGIQSSLGGRVSADTVNAISRWALKLYGLTDRINRAITLSVADQMTDDLAKGTGAAKRALSRFPEEVRRAVGASKSAEDVNRVLAEHLISTTQFNYNRLSMSEYGRYMGPIFSTFTKWPTAIAGEIIADVSRRGVLRSMPRTVEKFGVPLALAFAMNKLVTGGDEEAFEESDRTKKLLGKKGFVGMTPVSSITGLTDIFTPPPVKVGISAVRSFRELDLDDTERLEKGVLGAVSEAVQGFLPNSWILRLITDDIPTYTTGDRPEGSTFLERAANYLDR